LALLSIARNPAPVYRVSAVRFPRAYPIATPIGVFGSTPPRWASSQSNGASIAGRARASRVVRVLARPGPDSDPRHPAARASPLGLGQVDLDALPGQVLGEPPPAGSELVLAAHLGLGGRACRVIEDDLRLELGGEGESGTSGHRRHSEGTRGSLPPWPHFRGALQRGNRSEPRRGRRAHMSCTPGDRLCTGLIVIVLATDVNARSARPDPQSVPGKGWPGSRNGPAGVSGRGRFRGLAIVDRITRKPQPCGYRRLGWSGSVRRPVRAT
jgi:hypothetical protein